MLVNTRPFAFDPTTTSERDKTCFMSFNVQQTLLSIPSTLVFQTVPLFWLMTLTGRSFLWSNLLLRPFTSSLLSHFLLEVMILWIKFSPTSPNFSLLHVVFLLLVYLTTCLCLWGRESGRRPLSLNARSSSPETRNSTKEPVWADFFFKYLGPTFSHLICHVNSSLELSLTLLTLG